jgi:choline dehydrogenase-like flavoprotein
MGHGISCHVDVLRPYSRGVVGLDSSDPRNAPMIDPKFLSDGRDLKLLLKGAQVQQRIMESKPFDQIRGKMLYPTRLDDLVGMENDIRNRADTQYHPVGTSRWDLRAIQWQSSILGFACEVSVIYAWSTHLSCRPW